MTYQMAATAVTLNDLEGHSPVAGFFKCNPSNICAAFYKISTASVVTRFLCISRASCTKIHSISKFSLPFFRTKLKIFLYICVEISLYLKKLCFVVSRVTTQTQFADLLSFFSPACMTSKFFTEVYNKSSSWMRYPYVT